MHTHTARGETDGRILVVVHMLDILGEINHSPKTTKQTTTATSLTKATKTRFTLLRNVSLEKSAHKRKHNAAHLLAFLCASNSVIDEPATQTLTHNSQILDKTPIEREIENTVMAQWPEVVVIALRLQLGEY